jgi:hypothetical protein
MELVHTGITGYPYVHISSRRPKMRRRSKALVIYPAMRNTTYSAGPGVDVVLAVDDFLHAYCCT